MVLARAADETRLCRFCRGRVLVHLCDGQIATLQHKGECPQWVALRKVAMTIEEFAAQLDPLPACSCKRAGCPHAQRTECEACFQKRGPIAEKSVNIWHRELTCCTCGGPIDDGGHVVSTYVLPS